MLSHWFPLRVSEAEAEGGGALLLASKGRGIFLTLKASTYYYSLSSVFILGLGQWLIFNQSQALLLGNTVQCSITETHRKFLNKQFVLDRK